jgi:hypothetical protein
MIGFYKKMLIMICHFDGVARRGGEEINRQKDRGGLGLGELYRYCRWDVVSAHLGAQIGRRVGLLSCHDAVTWCRLLTVTGNALSSSRNRKENELGKDVSQYLQTWPSHYCWRDQNKRATVR